MYQSTIPTPSNYLSACVHRRSSISDLVYYTNPSLMQVGRISWKNPQNRCGNPVYASPKLGERPYKHAYFSRRTHPI